MLLGIFPSASFAGPETIDPARDEFLNTVQERAFRFFEQEVNLHNGLLHDSSPNCEGAAGNTAASIAGVGFALSAYPVAVERGWMSRAKAIALTERTLRFFLNEAPQEKGFFYHFLNVETGERANHSELSPIDTALFLAGALFAAEYFDDPKLRELAGAIYGRVDFPWMMNGGKTLALAWSPETGFSRQRWERFDESLLLYVLAIGSPAHPIPAESWREIQRPVGSYRDIRLIQMPPLFTHQYPHIWLDLRGKNDGLADYFQNSVNATLANRAFCIDQASQVAGYGPDVWGLSASEGPGGYRAYGAPPGWSVIHDGTVAPTACGSSIVFTPEESIACLEHIYAKYKGEMWGPYGFSDAMNPGKRWFSQNVLAIDQGPLLLMIENYRSGLLWKVMNRYEPVQKALAKIGFRPGTIALPWPDPPVYHAPFVPQGIRPDGFLKDWPRTQVIVLDPKDHKEFGDFKGPEDLGASVRFAWDREYLYFVAKVADNEVVAKRSGKSIWRDDMFELFVDPEGDGFFWNDPRDFQLGFRPGKDDQEIASWSWFQGGEDPSQNKKTVAKSYSDEKGYIIEGAIRWDLLGIVPAAGVTVRASPAVHDIDKRGIDGKLVWFFRNEEKFQRYVLGRIMLDKEGSQTNAHTAKKQSR
ncbi:MAG TPA: glucoamylase family protein [Candidatus Omnitrophota bacterium]|nr:glucoamylase family protein [Candidatus Omnitrophota bacterium]HPS36719.1 glucoamylase family protein [Candidatus Omnitrophota bacterium]